MMTKWLMYPILTPTIVKMIMIPTMQQNLRQQTLKTLSRSQEWMIKNLNMQEW